MKKIIKETVQRADAGGGVSAEMPPMEKALFRALAGEMRKGIASENVYTLDVAAIENSLAEEVTSFRLMGITEGMMQWIYEAKFEDGGYMQIRLISSVRYAEKARALSIRVNPMIEEYLGRGKALLMLDE